MNTTPPTACPAWKKLEAHADTWRAARLAELFRPAIARARAQMRAEAPGRALDYSRQLRGRAHAAPARAARRRARLRRNGAPRCSPAKRSTPPKTAPSRTPRCAPVRRCSRAKSLHLSNAIQNQEKRYRRIVNLGTGGSDLGPRLLAGRASATARSTCASSPTSTRWSSSARSQAPSRQPRLFVVVSKTFTTQETLANATPLRSAGASRTSSR